MPDTKAKILFVDDDPVTCSLIQRNCRDYAIECRVYQVPMNCLKEFEQHRAHLIVSDLRMPGMSGFELLKAVRHIDQHVPFLIMTGYGSVETAVQAMKLGATDFIKKPFEFEELKIIIERNLETARLRIENKKLKSQLQLNQERFGMIGCSEAMKHLFKRIEKVAAANCHVIINGESGSGKELVARALHKNSQAKNAPFIVIDCGALTESLLECELFGYEKGAFTGASNQKKGLMECASGGTLFLDEISNISDSMQMKLMRAIENQEITRVGGVEPIKTNLRVLAASNRNLEQMVASGEFRHDFYHRLNIVNVQVPPLRARREDIPVLIEIFLQEFARQHQRRVKGIDSKSIRQLTQATWKGNVRELKNTIERSVILADGDWISWPGIRPEQSQAAVFDFPGDQFISLNELENYYINHVLEHVNGNRSRAAKILQIDKTTLWRKLKKRALLE